MNIPANQNAIEVVGQALGKPHALAFAIAMVIIRARLVNSLNFINTAVEKLAEAGKPRPDWIELVREYSTSNILLTHVDVVERPDSQDEAARLLGEMYVAMEAVETRNSHYSKAIKNPDLLAREQLSAHDTPGSKGEAVLAFRQSWYAWADDEFSYELFKLRLQSRNPNNVLDFSGRVRS
jgi:hypothetical protein